MSPRSKFERAAAGFIAETVNVVPPMPLWALVTRQMPHLVRMGDGGEVQPLLRILLHAPSRYVFHYEIIDPRNPGLWMPEVLMLWGSGKMSPAEIIGRLREMYGWPGPEVTA